MYRAEKSSNLLQSILNLLKSFAQFKCRAEKSPQSASKAPIIENEKCIRHMQNTKARQSLSKGTEIDGDLCTRFMQNVKFQFAPDYTNIDNELC